MIGMTNEVQNISDNIVNINDHVPASVGGLRGHIVRRITHISMMIIPFLYYWNGTNISNFFFELEPKQFISIVAFIFVLIEIVRLRMGFVVFDNVIMKVNKFPPSFGEVFQFV